MSKEISKYQNLAQIGGDFMNSRNKLKKTENKINDIMEKNLKPEKENLEKAIKKYNEKAQTIMESSDMKNLQNSYQKHAKDAQSNLIKAQKEFIKISDEINNKKWSNEKKEKKIKELYDYILNKLYTKEDMENFKKTMNSMVVIVAPSDKSCKTNIYKNIK
jgi:isopentenyl diphosphate isomerase/L-lactate dehydrogenase-like FMN-dependent dehydrogenase